MDEKIARCGSFLAHNQQILTGLSMLGFNIIEDDNLPKTLIIAKIADKQIAYDMQDGWTSFELDERFLAWVHQSDVYCRRSLDNRKFKYGELAWKMHSLAPNYHCYNSTIKTLVYPGIKERLLSFRQCDVSYDRFESVENDFGNGKIIFLTRLYDPRSSEVENEKIAEERIMLNAMRIKLIQVLKQEYGKRALCGLSRDSYSLKKAPDLVLNRVFTYKPLYLREMKRASICVSTLGLHQSNGWKFAEYIAAGKAIVTERPIYEIPYAMPGENYLPFDDINGCIQHIDQLIRNQSLRMNMQYLNQNYYHRHLRPDKVILDSFVAGNIDFKI